MPKLGDLIGNIISEISLARAQGDAQTVRIAKYYAEEQAKDTNEPNYWAYMAVPRFKLPEVEIELPLVMLESEANKQITTIDGMYPVLKKEHDRFAEAERVLMQVLSFANMKGYLQTYTGSTLSQADLAKLWNTLSSDNDLRGGVSNVEGMVGKYDSLIVLDQALSLFA